MNMLRTSQESADLMRGLKHISAEPLDLPALVGQYHDPAAGAFVFFSGETRNHHANKAVQTLFYEAHESIAERLIREIIDDARQRFNLQQAFAVHRIGEVPVGESAVVVITASAHRKAAYAANEEIIHRIKTEVPIWKLERFADGSEMWSEGCHHGDVHRNEH